MVFSNFPGGSSLSTRATVRLGSYLSVLGCLRLSDTVTVRDNACLGSIASVTASTRIGLDFLCTQELVLKVAYLRGLRFVCMVLEFDYRMLLFQCRCLFKCRLVFRLPYFVSFSSALPLGDPDSTQPSSSSSVPDFTSYVVPLVLSVPSDGSLDFL